LAAMSLAPPLVDGALEAAAVEAVVLGATELAVVLAAFVDPVLPLLEQAASSATVVATPMVASRCCRLRRDVLPTSVGVVMLAPNERVVHRWDEWCLHALSGEPPPIAETCGTSSETVFLKLNFQPLAVRTYLFSW
jgi:hypothetical protein